MSDAKDRNIQLSARLQTKEKDLEETRKQVEELTKEKENLKRNILIMEEEKEMVLTTTVKHGVDEQNNDEKYDCVAPMMKKAEKRRLEKMDGRYQQQLSDTETETESEKVHKYPVVGMDFVNVQVTTALN